MTPGPHVERVLKRDTLGRVELVRTAERTAIQRVPSRVPIVATVARLLLRRERRALQALAGLAGVPQLLASPTPRGAAVRSYLPGLPLSQAHTLPRDFFAQLEQLLREVHARGICHNDLHKEGNILVLDSGRPGLIDFQLASQHRVGSRRHRRRAAEDLRHVCKHRARYCRAMGGATAAELVVPERSLVARCWRRIWKPLYNAIARTGSVRRHRGATEPRRARSGDWPTWSTAVGERPPQPPANAE